MSEPTTTSPSSTTRVGATGVLRATWLLAKAVASQLAARLDDRLARRLDDHNKT